jgi:hypothetical protein
MPNYKTSAKLNAIAGSLNTLDLISLMPTFLMPKDKEKISDSSGTTTTFSSYPTSATVMCITEASGGGGGRGRGRGDSGKIDTLALESASDRIVIHRESPIDKDKVLT